MLYYIEMGYELTYINGDIWKQYYPPLEIDFQTTMELLAE